MTLEKLLIVEELHAKTMRGSTTMVLEENEEFIINDSVGFEKFKITVGAEGDKAKLFLNGVEVLK